MSGKGLFAFVERMVGYVTKGLMALNLLVILGSVFFRYVLNSPIIWSEELAKFLLVWMVFLAASTSVRHWDNLRVTFLLEAMPPAVEKFIEIAIKLIAFGFVAFLFYLALKSIPNVWHREMAPALGISMVVPQLGVIVGLGLMVFQFIGLLIETIAPANSKERSGT